MKSNSQRQQEYRKRAQSKREDRICIRCGIVFKPHSSTSTFCSQTCVSRFYIQKAIDEAVQKKCSLCGAGFLDGTHGNRKLFCSKNCQTRDNNTRRGIGIFKEKQCANCGDVFGSRYKKRIYCSVVCGNKASRKRVGRSDTYRDSRELVYADKIAKGCSRCTEKRPSCLQYHHLNPSIKEASVGKLMQSAYPNRVAAEMAKCIILCANCHFVEENGDGYKDEDRQRV